MNIVDVVLVSAQEHSYDYIRWHEDMQLAYLASAVENEGLACRIVDFAVSRHSAEEVDAVIDEVFSANASVIAFIVDKQPTNNPFYVAQLVRRFRQRMRRTNTHMTLFGHTQAGIRRLLTEIPVDSVVTGEEIDFIELVAAVRRDGVLFNVPGLAFRADGEITNNPPQPLIMDLDELPTPQHYIFAGRAGNPDRRYVGAIVGSRGCYGKCSFCCQRSKEKLYHQYPWRCRSPKSIVDEIEALYVHHGVREFAFLDAQFFGPGLRGQKWASNIAQEIIARGMSDIAFSIYARADSIREETIALLKQAGLYAVFVGIESFSQEMLDRLNKNQLVADNIRAIEILKEYNIRLRMGFISFDYFTSFSELRTNIQAFKQLCETKANLITQPIFFQNTLIPLDDTPLAEDYDERGASVSDISISDYSMATQQRRMALNGNITNFSGKPRIALMCEASRLLATMILHRATFLELRAALAFEAGAECVDVDGLTVPLRQVFSWLDDLTLFAVEQFEYLVNVTETWTGDPRACLEEIMAHLEDACAQYDHRHLNLALTSDQQTNWLQTVLG